MMDLMINAGFNGVMNKIAQIEAHERCLTL
jgi:hypothetical protein